MKKLFVALLALGFSVVYAQTADVNNEPLPSSLGDNDNYTSSNEVDFYGKKKHDNKVYFHDTPVDFDYFGKRVTDGQPSEDGVTVDHKKNSDTVITFKAGRKNDSNVANDFKKATHNNVVGDYTYDKTPSDLNFYFYGRLSVNGRALEGTVYIGQGHSGSANNWWIGSDVNSASVFKINNYDCVKVPYAKGSGHAALCSRPGKGDLMDVNDFWPQKVD